MMVPAIGAKTMAWTIALGARTVFPHQGGVAAKHGIFVVMLTHTAILAFVHADSYGVMAAPPPG